MRRDHAGRGGNDRRGLRDLCANGRHCQGAGIAKEQVAQGNLLRILTAGDDVEDEDEDIGDAEAIDDRDPWTAPADGCRRQFVEGSLFNLEEKSSCRFSADAGSGIALCNSWLIIRKSGAGIANGAPAIGQPAKRAIREWPSDARCQRVVRAARRRWPRGICAPTRPTRMSEPV